MVMEEDNFIGFILAVVIPQGMSDRGGNRHAMRAARDVVDAFDLRGRTVPKTVADDQMFLGAQFRVIETAQKKAVPVHWIAEASELAVPCAPEGGSNPWHVKFVLASKLNCVRFEGTKNCALRDFN